MGGMCDKEQTVAKVETTAISKKVVVVGPSAVGKTTIIQQLLNGKTSTKQEQSIKSGSYKKTYNVNINNHQRVLNLNIWDTPGGEEFNNMKDLDYKGADVAVMVYSIDKESTFEEMDNVH